MYLTDWDVRIQAFQKYEQLDLNVVKRRKQKKNV